MYTIRCTKPLLAKLASLTPPGGGSPPPATTSLGDWYANRLNIGRHRLVLCTSEVTLLSVVVPAKDLPLLPVRMVESLTLLLGRIGVTARLVTNELNEMQLVRFDRTTNRSILGSMNSFTADADAFLRMQPAPVYLENLDLRLSDVPCAPLGYASPAERTRSVLMGAA